MTSKKIGRPMPIWQNMDIHCAGFTFVSNFDSGNLARVEEVSRNSVGKCLKVMISLVCIGINFTYILF